MTRVLTALIVLIVTVLAVSVTTAKAADAAGIASGTIHQCPGYPVPPYKVVVRDGVTFTAGNICHMYSGTVVGDVRGVQFTRIEADGSRQFDGRETLVGSVAGNQGTAEFKFRGSRACAPPCPALIRIRSVGGIGSLEGLHLRLAATGTAVFAYTGTFSIDSSDEQDE